MELLDDQPGVLFTFSTKPPPGHEIEDGDGVNVLWDIADIQALMEGNLKKARGCAWCRTCEHYGLHGYHTDDCHKAFPERHREDCKIHCIEEPPTIDESVEESDIEDSQDQGDDQGVQTETNSIPSGSIVVPTDITKLLYNLHTDVLGPLNADFALKIRLTKKSVNLKFYRQREIPGTIDELQILKDKARHSKLKGQDKIRYLQLRQEAKIKRREIKEATKKAKKEYKARLKELRKNNYEISTDLNVSESSNTNVSDLDAQVSSKKSGKSGKKSGKSGKKSKKIYECDDISIGEPELTYSSKNVDLTVLNREIEESSTSTSISAGESVDEDRDFVRVSTLGCVEDLVDKPIESEGPKKTNTT